MAKQLGVAEGQVYTCETAAYFWLLHVLSRWEKFSADAAAQRTPSCVQQLFPFKVRPGLFCTGNVKAERKQASFRACSWRQLFRILTRCSSSGVRV